MLQNNNVLAYAGKKFQKTVIINDGVLKRIPFILERVEFVNGDILLSDKDGKIGARLSSLEWYWLITFGSAEYEERCGDASNESVQITFIG